MSEKPAELPAEAESLGPSHVPSDNPAFKKFDEELLAIFKSYRSQRTVISVMMVVTIISFITIALTPLALSLILAGSIMYLYNLGNIVNHFSLVRKYRVELAIQGIESTPIFERAIRAKSNAIGSLVLASLPGGLVIAYIGISLMNTWLRK
jgi:hypothetical protein